MMMMSLNARSLPHKGSDMRRTPETITVRAGKEVRLIVRAAHGGSS
jgi:hypothetical protein